METPLNEKKENVGLSDSNAGLGAMTHFFCDVCQKIQPTFFDGANHADVSGKFMGGDVVCCECSFIIATAFVPNV